MNDNEKSFFAVMSAAGFKVLQLPARTPGAKRGPKPKERPA